MHAVRSRAQDCLSGRLRGCGTDERVGRAREDVSGRASRRPDDIMREQRVVGEASQFLRMSERWYSAYRVTGRVANFVGAGSPHPATSSGREPVFVQPIGTADERHDRFSVDDEDERLDDLCHVAADRRGSILGGSRPVRERTHLDLQPAARGRGDHSFRAPHVPRGAGTTIRSPELEPACAAPTQPGRARIAVRLLFGPNPGTVRRRTSGERSVTHHRRWVTATGRASARSGASLAPNRAEPFSR